MHRAGRVAEEKAGARRPDAVGPHHQRDLAGLGEEPVVDGQILRAEDDVALRACRYCEQPTTGEVCAFCRMTERAAARMRVRRWIEPSSSAAPPPSGEAGRQGSPDLGTSLVGTGRRQAPD